MKMYAIKITKSNLELIALLNNGVTPEVEKKPTWFIFDATWNSEVPNQIVSDREFLTNYEVSSRTPYLFALMKQK